MCVCVCVLGENEFICNDSLFKVLPSDCDSAGWLFIYRERERETSVLIKNTDGGKSRGRARDRTGEEENEEERMNETERATECERKY